MRIILWLYLFTATFFLWSCQEKIGADYRTPLGRSIAVGSSFIDSGSVVELNLKKKIHEQLMVSTILDLEYQVIHLETLPDVYLGEIEKVIVSEKYLFVFDKAIAKQLFIFDRSGNFVRKIGVRGKGPNEIDVPLDFDVVGHQIYLLDRQSRLFVFDYDGTEVSKIYLPFLATHVKVVSDNQVFLYTHEKNLDQTHCLIQIDENLIIQSEDFELQNGMQRYGIQQAFFQSHTHPLFCKFLSDTIYAILDDAIIPKYWIKDGKKPILSFSEKVKNDKLSNLLYPHGLAENFENLLFRYVRDQHIHLGIYWKKSDKIAQYKSVYDDYFLGALGSFLPVGVTKDSFIFQLNTYDWIYNFENIRASLKNNPSENKIFLEQLKDQIEKIGDVSMQDNHMLLIAKLKEL